MAFRFLTFCVILSALFTLMLTLEVTCTLSSASANPYTCLPTPEDEMGPLYKPGASVRNSVGEGYLLFGTVKSAIDCIVIPEAKIEIWMAGPNGIYGDAWRATLFSAENGTYYFTSHVPPGYGTGRAHLHVKVTAEGFQELVTQHYPAKGAGEAQFDLVLVPPGDKKVSPDN